MIQLTPTFGERCVAAIRENLKTTGKNWSQLRGEDVAKIIDGVDAPPAAEKPAKAGKRSPRLATDDETWILELESEPALAGVDIRRELGKCAFWCKGRGMKPTRQRFQNWLLKAERTVQVSGEGQSSFRPKASFGLPEPANWRQWLDDNRPECVYNSQGPLRFKSWDELDFVAKQYIRNEMGVKS